MLCPSSDLELLDFLPTTQYRMMEDALQCYPNNRQRYSQIQVNLRLAGELTCNMNQFGALTSFPFLQQQPVVAVKY